MPRLLRVCETDGGGEKLLGIILFRLLAPKWQRGEARPTRRASHLHILRYGAGVGGGIRVVCVPIKVVASISLWIYLGECVDGVYLACMGFRTVGQGRRGGRHPIDISR